MSGTCIICDGVDTVDGTTYDDVVGRGAYDATAADPPCGTAVGGATYEPRLGETAAVVCKAVTDDCCCASCACCDAVTA